MTLNIHTNRINIAGNLTTDKDLDDLKKAISIAAEDTQEVHLLFKDALVLNSSLIGYLVNFMNQESMNIHIGSGTETLYELIDYLGMSDIFNLQRI